MVMVDGVLHVMNTVEPLEPDLAATLELQGVIGAAEGPEEQMLGSVIGIELDDEGRIYVLEFREPRVRVYRPDGSYSHTIGREGQGPGELQSVHLEGIRLDREGNLQVADQGRLQYSIFSPSGDHLRDIRIGRTLPVFFETTGEGFIGVMQRMRVNSDREVEQGYYLNYFSPEGDSLSSMAPSSIAIDPLHMDARSFARVEPVIAVDALDRVWQTYRRHDEYRITVFELDGTVDRVVEKEFDQIRKSEAELEEERQLYVRMMNRLQQETGGLPPGFEAPVIDPLKTTIMSLCHDPHGYMWTQVNLSGRDATNTFDLFDMEGRFVTRLTIGDHERIERLRIGNDLLLAQTADDEGVTQITIYSFTIPGRR
jgi:hypothetical protein